MLHIHILKEQYKTDVTIATIKLVQTHVLSHIINYQRVSIAFATIIRVALQGVSLLCS
jgi:hypothetical protein